MDPKQALIDYLESVAAHDTPGMEIAHDALLNWIDRQGFVPTSIHKALDALRFAD